MRRQTDIYGLHRCMSGLELQYLLNEWGVRRFHGWRRKNLPLKAVYRDRDFTPEGQVEILRRRGYPDSEIAGRWPHLAPSLAACPPQPAPV